MLPGCHGCFIGLMGMSGRHRCSIGWAGLGGVFGVRGLCLRNDRQTQAQRVQNGIEAAEARVALAGEGAIEAFFVEPGTGRYLADAALGLSQLAQDDKKLSLCAAFFQQRVERLDRKSRVITEDLCHDIVIQFVFHRVFHSMK